MQEAARIRPNLTPEQLRGKLGTFLFSGEDVFKKTGNLSGGQQNRLILFRLVLSEPDVLVLDEPTNHLDIPSREMLEEALDGFNGAVIAVSHDRYFLDRLADQLMVVGCDEFGDKQMGRCEMICPLENKGVWSTYTELLQKRRQTAAEEKQKKSAAQSRPDKVRVVAPPELKRFNRFTVEQIETMIAELESKIAKMQERFGSDEVYRSAEKLAALQTDFEAAKVERELLYRAWDFRSQ